MAQPSLVRPARRLAPPVRRARVTPSLAVRYSLASLLVLLVSMVVIGTFVGAQIRQGVIHRTAATAALYVENFLVTQLQELGDSEWLTPARTQAIQRTLAETPLGREIVSVKIWAPGGRVVYGENAGQVFGVGEDQRRAWAGQVSSEITNLQDAENATQRQYRRLIETYVPMRIEGSDRVIAVAEFYQTVGPLEAEIRGAQLRSWVVVGACTLLTYLLLSGLVWRGSETIRRQEAALTGHVRALEGVLAQNAELHRRVRRAAARNAAHGEQVLRRVSSDLHDGPAQDLSFALLRLDSLAGALAPMPGAGASLDLVEQSLTSALHDIRTIATDLRLPDLEPLELREVLERALRDHRRRSDVHARLDLGPLPGDVPLPVKITAYRVVQEALTNATRHAPGGEVTVSARGDDLQVHLAVRDTGPGFSWAGEAREGHLGLVGMRERAESLGGTFAVRAAPGGGTLVEAHLPLRPEDDPHDNAPA